MSTLLLVGDQPLIPQDAVSRPDTARLLHSYGGGSQALVLFRSHGTRIDAVVTDVAMPQMDAAHSPLDCDPNGPAYRSC
jgi:CheY-like chemotaxis protein